MEAFTSQQMEQLKQVFSNVLTPFHNDLAAVKDVTTAVKDDTARLTAAVGNLTEQNLRQAGHYALNSSCSPDNNR